MAFLSAWVLSAAALLIAAWISLQSVPIVDQLRNLVFDSYQRQRPREYRADLPVRMADWPAHWRERFEERADTPLPGEPP